jgi:hypothetical protein
MPSNRDGTTEAIEKPSIAEAPIKLPKHASRYG